MSELEHEVGILRAENLKLRNEVARLSQQTQHNQLQLTIPKSVADALDVGDLLFLTWTHGNDLLGKVPDEERYKECLRRNAITKAYLAGKALGVDFVKVVEGLNEKQP